MKTFRVPTLVYGLCVVGRVLGQTRGVNLGGWLITEQWMTPSLYSSTTAADEWNLCLQMGKETAQTTMEEHWSTFYVRDDIVAISQAGLNTLRIPIGYWAVDLADYEPYVTGQYPYLIQAVQWAHELSMQVMISIHGAPGSQNGYEGSGLVGPILFPSNSSNIDRTLNVLKNLTTEFSNAEVYGNTVTSIEVLNEPGVFTGEFTMSELQSFYTEGINTIHTADAAMNATISDAWYGPAYWETYISTASSNVVVDTHSFYAFTPNSDLDRDQILADICNNSQYWKQPISSSGIPTTVIGEWSLQSGLTAASFSQSWRTWLRLLFEAQVAAYTPSGPGQPILGWIFWAWKTENDVNTWSYRRGIAQGFIPADAANKSQLVYPVLENGCVDTTFSYQAPAVVPSYVPPVFASSTTSGLLSASSKAGAAEMARRLGGRELLCLATAWTVVWMAWL